MSGRTIARLSQPFDGGDGPSHTAIERLWASEDADDYLPPGGNKADRVLGGLKALRDGRRQAMGQPELPPDKAKLRRVASALAEMLLMRDLVIEDDIAEALQDWSTPRDQVSSAVATPVPSVSPSAAASSAAGKAVSPAGPIFVVHGHDHGLLHEAVRVLERGTSRDVGSCCTSCRMLGELFSRSSRPTPPVRLTRSSCSRPMMSVARLVPRPHHADARTSFLKVLLSVWERRDNPAWRRR